MEGLRRDFSIRGYSEEKHKAIRHEFRLYL